ncbi:hypothetical protein [Streptomyces sp. S.PNR 29]|uniref:hypothetical protein n=1 Tax=Streptomyces sp. S.PNR 29 TaxID=2973805 RepID=UPI0025B20E93|nr:hypothetical protein [Streptomyces sp. S.PNR 29]MDN0195484.1 hypothetical protein [Streptomyces sp. S.PNR 29]
MIKSVVRGIVVTALTTTIALLPATAQAEESDEDNDIERIELTGVNWFDTTPVDIRTGDSWVTRTDLYAEKKTRKPNGRRLQYAGDGQAECSAVQVQGNQVTALCTRVLSLPKGTLTLSDMIRYSPREPLTAKTAITGGTGHYRSAYGDGYITLDGRYSHWKLNVDE